MIITRTPFRISFFGGGTDYPPWFKENGGSVLSTAIDKYCYISCRQLPPFFEHKYRIVYSKIENVQQISEIQHPPVRAILDWLRCEDGLEIHHDGDLPARSGLGSSSAFTVGLLNAINALRGQYITDEQLARDAIYIEQDVLKENVGCQDQIAAAFGGFNRIQFLTDGSFKVTPVILPRARIERLEQHLMLFFTGISRFASEVAKAKIDNLSSRQTELKRMEEMVLEALAILSRQNEGLDDFGRLLDESWQYKRSLSNKVSNSTIDDIYTQAKRAGALGGKLLGAGGGGFMVFFVQPEQRDRLREQLRNLIHVPFHFEQAGSRVVLFQPNGLK